MARRPLEGLVGREPAFSYRRLRTDPACSGVARDGDGTVFHFVTDGIHPALARAKAAAKGKGVRLGGGVATIRAYLQAGLIDEMHLAVSPVVLGAGEHLFGGINLPMLGFVRTEYVAAPRAAHFVLTRTRS
jgi:dihydrofolate reductase